MYYVIKHYYKLSPDVVFSTQYEEDAISYSQIMNRNDSEHKFTVSKDYVE